jgi:hypothetical protein
MRLEHAAGEGMFVDSAANTVSIADAPMGRSLGRANLCERTRRKRLPVRARVSNDDSR